MDVFFQTFIDIEKWDSAMWRGTVFVYDAESLQPPLLGIMFENIEAGKKIFSDWRKRLGAVDRYEELRVCIVEGEILGEDPGYSVHISSNPSHTEKRVKSEGKTLDVETAIVMSRYQRMTPAPGSPHLHRFKQEFARHKRFLLIPVSPDLKPEIRLAIGKMEILFRPASDIAAGDLDSVVFPVGYFDRDGTIQ